MPYASPAAYDIRTHLPFSSKTSDLLCSTLPLTIICLHLSPCFLIFSLSLSSVFSLSLSLSLSLARSLSLPLSLPRSRSRSLSFSPSPYRAVVFVERCGRRVLTLLSLAGVVVALVLLGASFYAARFTSPIVDANGMLCSGAATVLGTPPRCFDCVTTSGE